MSIIKPIRIGLISGTLALGGVLGCGGEKPTAEPRIEAPASNETAKSIEGQTTEKKASIEVDAKFQVTFDKAVIADDIPDDQLPPPDKTLAGKATGPLRAMIENLWLRILLTDDSGKVVPFVVTIETSLGDVEITLNPEVAPNHCRNLIALIKAQYFEGLCFDRIVQESYTTADGKKEQLQLVRGGCPVGTGDPGLGHLGYFLKPEFSEKIKHEEGSFGFWRDSDPATAGVRFYIALTPAPILDGEYTLVGKVSKGIDIVKAIAAKHAANPNSPAEPERPKEPVSIKKVKVSPDTVEIAVPVAHNDVRRDSVER